MSNLLAVYCAHNEDRTINAALEILHQTGVPSLALLDRPTPAVLEAAQKVRSTIVIREDIPHAEGIGVFSLERMLEDLHKAICAQVKAHNYQWVWWFSPDEIWHDVRADIVEAGTRYNVINYHIIQNAPTVQTLAPGEDFRNHCTIAMPDHELWLPYSSGPYHRVWRVDDRKWKFDNGGHTIRELSRKVMDNGLKTFSHFPAVDFDQMLAKRYRRYPMNEILKGWHVQYQKIRLAIV